MPFAFERWRRKRVSLLPLFWALVLFLGQPTGQAVAAETVRELVAIQKKALGDFEPKAV